MERAATKLAMMLRERDNHVHMGIQVGIVTKPLPYIEIKVGDSIVLYSDMVVFAEHLMKHTRQVTLQSSAVGESMSVEGYSPHTHDITDLTITGSLDYLDELKVGDEVILMPTADEQTYYVLDRVVRV